MRLLPIVVAVSILGGAAGVWKWYTSRPDASNELLWAVDDGDAKGVQRLLAGGAKVDGVTEDGLSALMLASHKGNASIAKLLLDAGAFRNPSLA